MYVSFRMLSATSNKSTDTRKKVGLMFKESEYSDSSNWKSSQVIHGGKMSVAASGSISVPY